MSRYSAEEIARLLRRFGMERDRYVKLLARNYRMGRAEFDALDYIEEVGELTPNQLSEHLCLTSGATTALIDRLEAAGLLARHPHPTDRRSWLLRLTNVTEHRGSARLGGYVEDLVKAAAALNEHEREAAGAFLTAAADTAERHAKVQSDHAASRKSKRSLEAAQALVDGEKEK